jgi:hypothetical protein
MTSTYEAASSLHCELRFASLSNRDRELAFPCDEQGQVNLDLLGERARSNYFFARAMRGRAYASPRVVRPFA